jgi:hypothetical protein
MPLLPRSTFGHPISSSGLSLAMVCLNISRGRSPTAISPLAQEAKFSQELLVASRAYSAVGRSLRKFRERPFKTEPRRPPGDVWGKGQSPNLDI